MNEFLKVLICLLALFSLLFLSGCSRKDDGGFFLTKENDTLFYLNLKTDLGVDNWKLPYPVYRFETGDMNGDGSIDALVGVEKTTRFDTVMGKRIFMFQNRDGKVRPLWLGSRLGQPIVDFTVVCEDGNTYLRSLEQERDGKYLVADYCWDSFGVKFIRYICREFDFESAKEFLVFNYEKI